MKVRIVCYEDVNAWILGKFALKMKENLDKMGIQADISNVPDVNADINHHIIYLGCNEKLLSNDTLMITHVDTIDKLNLVKKQLKETGMGICMSKETMAYLIKKGVSNKRICYINPAHDGIISIRKVVIGITCRVQIDGRKRENFITKLARNINPMFFKFKIMGDSWEPQVKALRDKAFEVEYYDHFIYEEYTRLIPSLDYYLYTGMDEGQMGFVDALAAGVKTIVTPQGYHLDAPYGITHSFTTYDELEKIFLDIQKEKEQLVASVKTWNWFDYTQKHVEVWQYLLNNKVNSNYEDGINSSINYTTIAQSLNDQFIKAKNKELYKNKFLHSFFVNKNKIKNILSKNKH